MYKIVITETALKDIEDAVFYIKNELHSPTAATALLGLVREKIDTLKTMPCRNPLVKDELLCELGFRFLLVKKYIAFYTVSGDTVTVVRFLHSKRNWIKILGDDASDVF